MSSTVQAVRCRVVAAAARDGVAEQAPATAARAPAAKPLGPSLAPAVRGAARGARVVAHAVAEKTKSADPRYAAFAAALEKYDFNFRVGDKVTGTVILVDNNGIYVDIGAKGAAFCPAAECAMGKTAKASRRRGAPRRARASRTP